MKAYGTTTRNYTLQNKAAERRANKISVITPAYAESHADKCASIATDACFAPTNSSPYNGVYDIPKHAAPTRALRLAPGYFWCKRTLSGNYFVYDPQGGVFFYANEAGEVFNDSRFEKADNFFSLERACTFDTDWEVLHFELFTPCVTFNLSDLVGCIKGTIEAAHELFDTEFDSPVLRGAVAAIVKAVCWYGTSDSVGVLVQKHEQVPDTELTLPWNLVSEWLACDALRRIKALGDSGKTFVPVELPRRKNAICCNH